MRSRSPATTNPSVASRAATSRTGLPVRAAHRNRCTGATGLAGSNHGCAPSRSRLIRVRSSASLRMPAEPGGNLGELLVDLVCHPDQVDEWDRFARIQPRIAAVEVAAGQYQVLRV